MEHCLHSFHPKRGDCVFIPAGTVHALGAGLIVAEIQQASDTTFRLFDWNRVDQSGKPRPLHLDQAFEVIDFDMGPVDAVNSNRQYGNSGRLLVDCDKFRLIELDQSTTFDCDGKFKILTLVQGSARIAWPDGERSLPLGGSVFLPAACVNTWLQLASDSRALLATGPSKAYAESHL
jgi:mannose-6-phosphate isomerase